MSAYFSTAFFSDQQTGIVAEQRLFGFTYADLSAEPIKSCQLLDDLHLAIARYLEPVKASGHRREATRLHVAV